MKFLQNHESFILTPIESEIEQALSVCTSLRGMMEAYPLRDYLLQSLFLKMTGAQEQKSKCLIWVVATADPETRRLLLEQGKDMGEFSTFKSKNKVYALIEQALIRHNSKFELDAETKKGICDEVNNFFQTLLEKSIFSEWNLMDESKCEQLKKIINEKQFANKVLVQTIIQEEYEILYRNRNRLAHNTISYQMGIPSLTTLSTNPNEYENYIVWFAILILIDKVYIELYKQFKAAYETMYAFE